MGKLLFLFLCCLLGWALFSGFAPKDNKPYDELLSKYLSLEQEYIELESDCRNYVETCEVIIEKCLNTLEYGQ